MKLKLFGLSLIGFGAFLGISSAQAAIFTVNTFDDPAPVAAPNGCTNGGRCSLREASLEVNALGGNDTIVLGEGTYNLTIPETDSNSTTPTTGDLDFVGPGTPFQVTIQGVSPDKTIVNAAPGLNERLMQFSAADLAVTLSNLTIQNGNSPGSGGGVSISSGATTDPDPANILNCNFLNNHAVGTGGGAFLDGSHPVINVDGGTYSGNTVDGNGGGLALSHGAPSNEFSSVKNIIVTNNKAQQGNGGGIYFSSSAEVTISNVQVSNNHANNPSNNNSQGLGGGIYISDGGNIAGQIFDSVITNNTADGESSDSFAGGGAFTSGSGVVQVRNTTFSGNQAMNNSFGGGILVTNGGGVQILSSTFSGNSAGEGGGAFISGSSGTLKEVTNSTFSGNQTTNGGGGIWVDRADGMSVNNDTIVQNTAGSGDGAGIFNANASVDLRNSIFASNDSAGNSDDCIGPFHSAGFNIFASVNDQGCTPDSTMAGTGPNDSSADPMLGPLAANGGPTLTHALLSGSPAIDGGNPTGCKDGTGAILTTDQRGQTRPLGPICDIGAVEEGSADLTMTKTADASTVQVGDDITYTLTVKNNGPDNELDVTIADTLPANVTLVSVSNGCAVNNGTVACDVGPLNSGASASVTLTVTTTAVGQVTNSASASGTEFDPNPNDNTSSVTTIVTSGGNNGGGGGCQLNGSEAYFNPISWACFTLTVLSAWAWRRRRA